MAPTLGQSLIRNKFISGNQLLKASDLQKKDGGLIGSCLIKLGFMTEEALVSFFSEHYNVPAITLSTLDIDPSVFTLVSIDTLNNYQIFPVSKEGSTLKLAMADPSNMFAIDDVKFMTNCDVEPVVAAESEIKEAIAKHHELSKALQDETETLTGSGADGPDVTEGTDSNGDMAEPKKAVKAVPVLKQLLLREKIISEDQLLQADDLQKGDGGLLGACLIKLGFITEEAFVSFLSEQYNVPAVTLSTLDIDPSMITLVSIDTLNNYQIFPVSKEGSTLKLAMADPSNMFAIDDVKFMTNCDVEPFVAAESEIKEAIAKHYEQSKALQDETESLSGSDDDGPDLPKKSVVHVDTPNVLPGEVNVQKISYGGWKNCIQIANGVVDLIITVDVGPRIIRYGFTGQENEMCEIESTMGLKAGDEWRLYGGHRLWHSPEAKPRTYEPDNSPVEWKQIPNGVKTFQEEEPRSRIRKEMQILLSPESSEVNILHRLTNAGPWPVELSVWSITAMATGGMEIVPQEYRDTGLLPNRILALWPYTKMNDPRVQFGDKYITLRQDPEISTPLKFGISNAQGWAAYFNHNHLFVKYYSHNKNAVYPDFGVSYETYTNNFMIEMETLSPLTMLEPGAHIEHMEKWELFNDVPMPGSEQQKIDQILDGKISVVSSL